VAGRGVRRLRERLGVVALLNVLAGQARVLAGAGDVGDVDVTRRRAVEADKQLRLVGRVRVTGRHAAVVGGVPRVHRRGARGHDTEHLAGNTVTARRVGGLAHRGPVVALLGVVATGARVAARVDEVGDREVTRERAVQ